MSEVINFHFIFEVIIVGLVLSADSFSAAVAMGHRPFSEKDAFRFAISSGGAEALVALVGALAGNQVIRRFEAIDHWVAFILLGAVAVHMAYEGLKDLISKEVKEEQLDFHSFTKILIVSFATSLDAFGVGIGLGISNKPLAPFIVSIGFWAFTTTILGLHLAKKLSDKFGPIMNLVGASVLGILAFQMLKI
ncbi:MAG: manganese efflux pump MntP [Bdellovibrio sp.]